MLESSETPHARVSRPFPKRFFRARVTLALCSLATGAALVVAILARIPLGVALLALASLVGVAATLVARSVDDGERRRLGGFARAGAIGGAGGVLAYDLVRWSIVTTFALHVRPFETFKLFGASILQTEPHTTAALVVGTAYHYANGVLFGSAYGMLAAGRAWFWAVGFAFALEAFMLALYPGWLHIGALLEEFTIVSCCGHLAYGSVLGVLTARFARRTAP